MTQEDAKRIEQAALVMLHVANAKSGDAHVRAALRHLPAEPKVGGLTLRAAWEYLEKTDAWKDAIK